MLRRLRRRSPEINQQVATIHQQLAQIWHAIALDQARAKKLEQLAAVDQAMAQVPSSHRHGKLRQDLWQAPASRPGQGA